MEVRKVERSEGYVYFRINCSAIYCYYISANISIKEYKNKVNKIIDSVYRKKEECIILGDINSKSIQWGLPITDKRGKYWTEWMSTLNLVVYNNGMEPTPTFVREITQFLRTVQEKKEL